MRTSARERGQLETRPVIHGVSSPAIKWAATFCERGWGKNGAGKRRYFENGGVGMRTASSF